MYCAVEPAQYVVFTDSHILDPVTEPKSPKNNQHDKAIKLNSFGKLLSINLVDVPVEKKKKEELRVRKKKKKSSNQSCYKLISIFSFHILRTINSTISKKDSKYSNWCNNWESRQTHNSSRC